MIDKANPRIEEEKNMGPIWPERVGLRFSLDDRVEIVGHVDCQGQAGIVEWIHSKHDAYFIRLDNDKTAWVWEANLRRVLPVALCSG